MAGIYIHIPFCKKACHYCNFHFSTQLKNIPSTIAAIEQELFLQKDYLANQVVETIYFGGGTPSLLELSYINSLLESINKHYHLADDLEITLEANPDDISTAVLQAWQLAGINRISLGVQSLDEKELEWMNRAHHASQSLESIMLIPSYFQNYSIDFIYGSPLLNHQAWERTLEFVLSKSVPHLSCYALTVEPKTALAKLISKEKRLPINNEHQAIQFETLIAFTAKYGYEQYEISNFCKSGFESRHNSNYWSGNHYLGVGPAAHSFNKTSRQWNISNNALYIKAIAENTVPFEKETLSPIQQLNEYIMTSLRTAKGISLLKINEDWGEHKKTSLLQQSKKYLESGYMLEKNNYLILTTSGKLAADGIAAALFF